MNRFVRIFWRIFFGGFLFVILVLILANFGVLGEMPSIDDIENPSANLSSQVYAQDGTLMGKYYLEDRVNVDYEDISKHVISALVATEDKRFYKHSGVDGKGLLRAFSRLGSAGGASTITMQTAKNLFTENWATKNFLLRGIQKIKECIIAVKLEQNFTKEEIATLYLNTVAFSDNVYGIRNASKTFFQKEPDRLNIEESAVLIGMVNGPGIYNPRRFPKQSQERRNLVFNRMVEFGALQQADYDKLKKLPIQLNYQKLDETTGLGPYFRMILGEEMKKWCKEHPKSNGENYDLYSDGLKIYTTINPHMQVYAEEAVAKHMSYMQKILDNQLDIKSGSVWNNHANILENAMKQTDRWRNMKKEGIEEVEIAKSFLTNTRMKVFAWNSGRSKDTVMTPLDSIKYHRQMLSTGFMAMDAQSGEVRAWVGGIDYKTFKYDHVNFNTKRQVGSTIKPLLYSLAIEDAGLTPNSTVYDQQQSFGAYGKVPATTKSCSGGALPMSSALAYSKNCATAYIMKQLDGTGNNAAKRFVDFLNNKCGLQTKIEPNPSIALGACEISLYEMMQAYSMLPGRGFNVKPMFITRIEDRNGNTLQSFTPVRREVISDVTAYSMIKMMQGVMEFGTGKSIWGYGVSGEIAGKTGTTNDNSDAWFMGYTPQLLCGAWVGCDDRFIRFKSTKVGQGSSAALPIWAYFYEKVQNDRNIVGIDPGATFVKPDVMYDDISFDQLNGTTPTIGAEVEDMGNGTSKDYEIPSNIKPEDIGAESQIIPAETEKPITKPAETKPPVSKQITTPPAETKPPVSKPTTTPPAKLPDNKLQTQPATKPPTVPTNNQQPKAVMPPKKP